jgi:hypothetical protein
MEGHIGNLGIRINAKIFVWSKVMTDSFFLNKNFLAALATFLNRLYSTCESCKNLMTCCTLKNISHSRICTRLEKVTKVALFEQMNITENIV